MTRQPLLHASAAIDALCTRDLAVGYRTRRSCRAVLEGVNVSIRRGELVCLLGPNGIGKSTLLRTIARIQPALWGSVEVAGVDLRSLTQIELARRVGVVLTERVLADGLSARQVIELGRYPYSGWLGRLDARARQVVERAIDAAGTRHLVDRDVSRLSDGERQRVMTARALAQEPSLLVLDEPTAFLDTPSRAELMGLLRRLTRSEQLAVVVATHDVELALRTADVVWLVMPGSEVVAGAPEDVVLAGGIAQAFEGRQIRFHPDDRMFRILTPQRGVASVRGSGLRVALAKAVLEREGYGVSDDDAPEQGRLTVHVTGSGWQTCGDGACCGDDFASLAAFLRGRRTAA